MLTERMEMLIMQELVNPQGQICQVLYDEIRKNFDLAGNGFIEFPSLKDMLGPPRSAEDLAEREPGPEEIIPNDYLIPAKYLRELVLKEGVSGLRYAFYNVIFEVLGRVFPSFRKFVYKYGVVAGHHELRFILTIKRKSKANYFHLSVLPCRFGKMYDWETSEIKQSFQMHEPIMEFRGSTLAHFFWGELKNS